ncbi:uncharacterized homolog isoform X2 [Dendropsophus ebraccatus]|uniref:uncharacterized homolog isoform X2 n=1 Tax=Dendropsophus ebraccatus TaxID=150705 RepID=UPI0038313871
MQRKGLPGILHDGRFGTFTGSTDWLLSSDGSRELHTAAAPSRIHRRGLKLFAKQLLDCRPVFAMAKSRNVYSLLLLLLLCAQGDSSTQAPGTTKNTSTDIQSQAITAETISTSHSTENTTTNTVTAKASTQVSNTTRKTENSSASMSSTIQPEALTNTTKGSTHSADTTALTTNHMTQHTNRTETPNVAHASKGLSDNPGLVAVLCIFISVLCIALVVTAVRFCQKPNPQFEKLDEVPMNGMNEEAPFARYPPK